MTACPVRTRAGLYAQAIARGDLERAVRIARASNPMVRTTAWVCTHPCESGCVRQSYDAPLALRALKRYAVERVDPTAVAPEPRDTRGEGFSIAVIGGGPAGLAAAHDLALLGYRVTVFEAAKFAGGMPAQLIPSFRLPRAVVAADVADVERLGVVVRTGVRVQERPAELRAAGFDRVIVTTGAPRGIRLDIPGAHLPGVIDALDVLAALDRGDPVDLGERSVIVGGGDTAVDVARAIRRAGPNDVSIAFRRPRIEGRARGEEAARAVAEGIHLRPGVIPVGVHGSQRVGGLILSEVVTYHDAGARYRPRPRPGTRTLLEADSVVVAVGRKRDPEAEELVGATYRTDHGAVLQVGDGWAAGGDLGGAGTVVAAMADGQALARWADRELTQGAGRTSVRLAPAEHPLQRSPRTTERQTPDSPATASIEGSRCLNCWKTVILAEDGECLKCGRCAEACPGGALLNATDDGDPPFLPRPPAPVWLDGHRCLRCGLCVERCPVGCLEFVETVEESHDG